MVLVGGITCLSRERLSFSHTAHRLRKAAASLGQQIIGQLEYKGLRKVYWRQSYKMGVLKKVYW